MKKNRLIILGITLLVCFGCQGNQEINDTTSEFMNDNDLEESSESEIDNIQPFTFSEEKIINLQEVTEAFPWTRYEHDFKVEVDMEKIDIPEEILEVLVSENNGSINSELYNNYLTDDAVSVDLDTVNVEILGDTPILSMKRLDINYDGMDEYLIWHANGAVGDIAVTICNSVDGKMKELYFISGDDDPHYEVLEVNDQYYILAGNYVTYYDTELQDWCKVAMDWRPISYERHEFYSNTEISEDDLFANIDLSKRVNWTWQNVYEYSFICGSPHVFQKMIGKHAYYYVYTDFRNHSRNNRSDRLLFVLQNAPNKKFEIIEAYYLVPELELTVDVS